jgi:hypothetical protein
MSEPPVQFDHDAVALVQPITAATASARVGERRLPDRLRQPMCPFHVPLVAKLQHRVVAASRGGDEFMQVSPPAQLGALTHRRAQPALVGQVARERAGHPPAHVVKRGRRLRQVKHRLLHPGPRWIAIALHRLDRPPRPVQADSFSRNRAALARNCHVNRFDRLVSEPLDLGCCFVTEHCASPGRKDCRPQLRATPGNSRERRVHTGITCCQRPLLTLNLITPSDSPALRACERETTPLW